MSKSLGNDIPISGDPKDMYGKLMSLPDKAMSVFSRLVTSWTPAEIDQFEQDLNTGNLHPRDAKMKLAYEIVSIYHGEENAQEAETAFKQVFQEQGQPDEMNEYALQDGQSVLDVLQASGLTESRSEARRLIDQNAVRLNDQTLNDPHADFPGKGILQVGKRRFVRVV
jgi:tyrosyl-tRNA synthetase